MAATHQKTKPSGASLVVAVRLNSMIDSRSEKDMNEIRSFL
jgi:hypothetical protein